LVRIIPAMSPADIMSEFEVDRFLQESRIPLRLGTVDEHRDPVIHPLWYHYEHGRFYLITARDSRKMKNVSRRGPVYFCIDTEARPYKGVKGKGTLAGVEDREKAVRLGEKIVLKYMGNVDNPLGKFLIGRLREGEETLLEITPRFYSVWDDSKS
jgi:nitroimidazol reductase NimA-like FMN-containing flavoprotein (pyridoxamine 5'-phosphate oxidase superfamily)